VAINLISVEIGSETVLVTYSTVMQFETIGNQPPPDTHHIVDPLI
jgi:hypothetical protein